MDAQQYLLDTCILIDMFKGRFRLQEKTKSVGIDSCCTASICVAEMYVGYYKLNDEGILHQIDWAKRLLTIHPVDDSLRTYAYLRALLEKKGTRLEDLDLFVAAVALDHDLTLVTHNTRHFDRIPGLRLEDWR